jgi:hypothetical protein
VGAGQNPATQHRAYYGASNVVIAHNPSLAWIFFREKYAVVTFAIRPSGGLPPCPETLISSSIPSEWKGRKAKKSTEHEHGNGENAHAAEPCG